MIEAFLLAKIDRSGALVGLGLTLIGIAIICNARYSAEFLKTITPRARFARMLYVPFFIREAHEYIYYLVLARCVGGGFALGGILFIFQSLFTAK